MREEKGTENTEYQYQQGRASCHTAETQAAAPQTIMTRASVSETGHVLGPCSILARPRFWASLLRLRVTGLQDAILLGTSFALGPESWWSWVTGLGFSVVEVCKGTGNKRGDFYRLRLNWFCFRYSTITIFFKGNSTR